MGLILEFLCYKIYGKINQKQNKQSNLHSDIKIIKKNQKQTKFLAKALIQNIKFQKIIRNRTTLRCVLR